MESEGEDSISFKLSLLNIPAANMQSPLRSGLATPPLRTLASVPFKWEEEPGKPRPCTDLIILPEPAKFLELPPCRMPLMEPQPTNKITKSPNTVLDGPYNVGRPKFSSFRFFRETGDSFDSCSSASPESAVDVFLGKKSAGISSGGQKGKGIFGRTLKWKGGGGKKEINNNGISISSSSNSSCDSDDQSCTKVKIDGKMRRNGSFSSVSHASPRSTTHIWASIYQGFKHVMPWKSAKK